MPTSADRPLRRTQALTRTKIIDECIAVLDSAGEEGLTVRTLSARLSTGRGALYHHVATKDEMLSGAADVVVRRALSGSRPTDPGEHVRLLALNVFDAITAHPWLGTQLSREPMQPAVLLIWTSIGAALAHLGESGARRADAGAALVNYILGATAHYAAGALHARGDADRAAYLAEVAAAWIEQHPSAGVTEEAQHLRAHDDRRQFLAGLEIFLAGLTVRR